MYGPDNSDSDGKERRKKLYVMYGGSWELVSRRDVKTLRREVLSAKPGVPQFPSGHLTARRTWPGLVYYL